MSQNWDNVLATVSREANYITPSYVKSNDYFHALVDSIYRLEGGFNSKIINVDRGGLTFMGIASNTSDKHKKFIQSITSSSLSLSDKKNLAGKFYVEEYINSDFYLRSILNKYYALGLLMLHFKIWGSPYKRFVKLVQLGLQSTGNAVAVDGICGRETLNALQHLSAKQYVHLLSYIYEHKEDFWNASLNSLLKIPGYQNLAKGFSRRLVLPFVIVLNILKGGVNAT